MARGFSQQDAALALHEAKNRTTSRQEHLETFGNVQIPHDHDEVDDSPSPVYDAFHSLRSENGIQNMTNFTAAEFEAIWSSIAVDATAAWKNHRGARSKQTAVSGLDSDDELPPRRRQRTTTASYDSEETQM